MWHKKLQRIIINISMNHEGVIYFPSWYLLVLDVAGEYISVIVK